MALARPAAPILVVDDNADVRAGLCALLESEGYQTVDAADGREALSLLRRAEVMPCLIVLDLMMPRVDGWDFRAVQTGDARLASIPVVVLSAHPLADDAKHGGAAAVLRKPMDPEALLAVVARYSARS
jgi:two-component system, chemotaxis family, chemotaxis protein CheY